MDISEEEIDDMIAKYRDLEKEDSRSDDELRPLAVNQLVAGKMKTN